MNSYKYVILGGGVAAGYAAQEFVAQGLRPGELCIISAEASAPYERPPLSKQYLAGRKDHADILINDEEFYQEHGITLHLKTTVTRADLEGRVLHTRQGGRIGFEKLLIATGSQARQLNIPNADLEGIFYLRTDDDAAHILDAYRSQDVREVLVVGGGYIGMEVSAVLAAVGMNVSIVFPEERLMERWFTPAMSLFFEKYYQKRGVALLPNCKPVRFHGADRVESVMLSTGEILRVDAVVAGIGVKPELKLFQNTPLNLQYGQGIAVNKYLETNLPGIWAAGDVASYYDTLFDKRRRIEHWQNAVNQGRHAARAMLSGRREMFMQIPYFFSDIFDLSYEFWGDIEGHDQVIHRGDLGSASFSVWWLRQGAVIAAFVMDRPNEERELAPEWIRLHHQPRVGLLHDASIPLRDPDRVTV